MGCRWEKVEGGIGGSTPSTQHRAGAGEEGNKAFRALHLHGGREKSEGTRALRAEEEEKEREEEEEEEEKKKMKKKRRRRARSREHGARSYL